MPPVIVNVMATDESTGKDYPGIVPGVKLLDILPDKPTLTELILYLM